MTPITQELPKAFDPTPIEAKWTHFWDHHHCFTANPTSTKPAYCIVMPPPNVTGVLHMGHALVNTLQDVLIRWKRMSGFEALWVPGTDHAGIATQTVVERHLMATMGKRRKDFSREEFLKHTWAWKEESQDLILAQLKKLGCSCDWSRLCFSLDESRSLSVRKLFKKLFAEGLIYRGDYLVNWDPVTQTALADDEVEYEERNSFLWYLRYPLVDETGSIIVATTRPETLLGDMAIAVAPSDPRYQHLIGKRVHLPLTSRTIPILADRRVDASFGTGAVKITPAHDPNDYEIGLDHGLSLLNIMTQEGKINASGGEFESLSMEEAREAVIARMHELQLIEKIEPHIHRVGVSYRSKAVIEPFLSKQWFVKMSSFKKQLRSLVEQKQVKLLPENWENTYFHWIDNLRDWCISRQLWWGHRIPIWYHKQNPEKVLCFEEEGLPPEVKQHPEEWVQEEDVLDTWFSSALWPFSTLGWPHETPELHKFYPNSVLVTGHDILFFWVARMILMGSYAMDTPPFPEVFLHGLIYGKSYWRSQHSGSIHYITGQERLSYDLGKPLPPDVQCKWEKMSKSKGNVLDPLEIIESYGTDAMRMALCASATQARQIDLDRRKFEEFKNFANKVWNGARFVFMHLQDFTEEAFASGLDETMLQLEDRWIISLLNRTIEKVLTSLSQYHFDKAALIAYDFFWKDFCAYYVEMSKPYLLQKTGTKEQRVHKQKLLSILLLTSIRLLHPMAPFITEEIFSLLKGKLSSSPLKAGVDVYTKEAIEALQAQACMLSSYPKVLCPEDIQPGIEEDFLFLDEIVHAIRNIRAEMQLPPSAATDVWIFVDQGDPALSLLQSSQDLLHALVKIQTLQITSDKIEPPLSAKKQVRSLQIVLPLPKEFKEKEKMRLSKEQEKMQGQMASLQAKLSQEEFRQKAPKEILEKLTGQASLLQQALTEITSKLNLLEKE